MKNTLHTAKIRQMTLNYFKTRLLLRNFHFYLKQEDKSDDSVINSHAFLEAYFGPKPPSDLLWLHKIWYFFGGKNKKKQFISEKFSIIKDCCRRDEHYLFCHQTTINHVEGKQRQEYNISITPAGKDAWSIPAILFVNMGILMGFLAAIIGAILGAIATLLVQHLI